MGPETVRIEHLHLRVPGQTVETGERLGQQVAEQIASGLPERVRPLHLGALDLRLVAPPGSPPEHLARLIAKAVLERVA